MTAANYKAVKYKNSSLNTSIKILSNIDNYKNSYMQETISNIQSSIEKFSKNSLSLEQFKRKFIVLNNNYLKLNLELEICIDHQNRLFVRHYIYFRIYYGRIKADDLEDQNVVKNCLSTLE